ncbi:hypothetical protein [Chloroflexus aggregans]|uniref:Uncharacterized protein n=1 Tax=Chloroflexus aggregans (strain MD-66 / DSM 9485) TaxID=326427 RepID=B8G5P5_CHLAD|nr:hypothetical protein [Chloroflexus aggregans]ACL23756.1 conserved hypothetical protein [Chloroflexus aggregans DSM 9485]
MDVKRWVWWSGVVVGIALLAVGCESLLGVGGAGLAIAMSVIAGGIVTHWRQRDTISCRINGPRLRPLQVSAFGLMGLGVVCYQLHGGGAIATLSAQWPIVGASWVPLVLVAAGVGWLGFLSIGSDCRDEQLLAAMGERER